MLISNPLKKLQKISREKLSMKKLIILLFIFIMLCKSCRSIIFGGNFFALFFQRFRTQLKFCVLWYPYRIFEKIFFCLYLHFLLTLKPKSDTAPQKKEKQTQRLKKRKNIFNKCVSESYFKSISRLGGSILSQKVKIVVPYPTQHPA
jgi:hypothetical protein